MMSPDSMGWSLRKSCVAAIEEAGAAKVRVLTEIPDDDIEQLDALASKRKSSRAAAIREAVKQYLVQNADNNDWIQRGRGYWKGRKDIGDGLEYQRAIREDRTPYDEL